LLYLNRDNIFDLNTPIAVKLIVFNVAIALASFIFLHTEAQAQKKYSIVKGEINFASNAELELIKASSTQVQGLIDPSTHQFAFTVDIKSFKGFNSALQREHFNEKYMESEVYPKARFTGKIIEQIDFSQKGTYDVRAKGDLEIHGQKQTRIIKGKLTVRDDGLKLVASFAIPLADHNITIPNIVSQKIATEIIVDFDALMSLQ
jgi:polyisoprenoid-binding protein YceI